MFQKTKATILVVACGLGFGLSSCTKDQDATKEPAIGQLPPPCVGCTSLSAEPEPPDPCHGLCDPLTETCVATSEIDGNCEPNDCADIDPCTVDTGTPGNCVHTDKVCPDDGDLCNGTPYCEAGACVATAPLDCGDGSECTTDACDPAMGCVWTPVVCGNNNACDGTETCDPALGCQAGTPLVCGNNSVCDGTETCDPVLGCQAGTPLACANNSVCDGTETCDPVLGCQAGTSLACADGDPCTTDGCDPAAGCTFVEEPGCPECIADSDCANNSVCDGTETCDPVLGCQAGTPLACADGNQCTTDGCDPAAGCTFTAIVPCEFGEVCGNWMDDDGDGDTDCGDSECGPNAFFYLLHVLSPGAQVSFWLNGFPTSLNFPAFPPGQPQFAYTVSCAEGPFTMKATPTVGGPGLAVWVDLPTPAFGVFTPWVGAIMNWVDVHAQFGGPDVTTVDYTTGETVPALFSYQP